MHSDLVAEQLDAAALIILEEARPFVAHRGKGVMASGALTRPCAPEKPVPVSKESRAKIAEDLVNGARAKDYGDADTNLKLIAAYWSLHLDKEITKTDVCIMMDLLKTARLKHTPDHEDSWVDKVGYILLQAKIDRRT